MDIFMAVTNINSATQKSGALKKLNWCIALFKGEKPFWDQRSVSCDYKPGLSTLSACKKWNWCHAIYAIRTFRHTNACLYCVNSAFQLQPCEQSVCSLYCVNSTDLINWLTDLKFLSCRPCQTMWCQRTTWCASWCPCEASRAASSPCEFTCPGTCSSHMPLGSQSQSHPGHSIITMWVHLPWDMQQSHALRFSVSVSPLSLIHISEPTRPP